MLPIMQGCSKHYQIGGQSLACSFVTQGISDLAQNVYCMFDTLILGTKKISVIACGQTSSMALSDAGEVGQSTKRTKQIV